MEGDNLKNKYIGTKDFQERLNCGHAYAYGLMQMFRARGQAYNIAPKGSKREMLRVSEKTFESWLEDSHIESKRRIVL